MRRSFTFLGLAVLASSGARTNVQSNEPWPELKKLEYFLGDWFEEGDVKPGPFGPGGRVTMNDHREWMDGKFFILIHSTFTALKGAGTGISFIGYDPNAKVYTYDEFYSQGEAVHSRGRLEGDQWIWTMNDMKVGSQMVKARNIYKMVSATLYTFRFETSADGGATWTLAMDGTARKESKRTSKTGK